ncbi:MAG: family F420-dependent class oxidoreductase [Acidimicrobiales bacterium]|nr:family F420-dependent class oxidoreductase [Acidimicrobiales bacterium]
MRFSIGTAFLPPDELLPIAQAADEAGYHAVALSDHVVNLEELHTPYPYTEDGTRRWKPFTPWVDPWVAIGAMAAVTRRIRFFTNVYVLPMRNPLTVAKCVGTAALLSGDRVSLGIGMGWCEEEFELMEQPFRGRGRRADEMIALLSELWQGGWVEHHGESYDIPRLEMSPTPSQPVPVYVGGMSDAALRRAARNDGWISDYLSTDEAIETRATIDGYRAEYGTLERHFSMICSLSDALTVDDYRRAEEGGVTEILTMPWVFYGGFKQDLDQKLDGLRRFADEVAAKLPD